MFCYFPPGTIIFSNWISFYFFSDQGVKLIVLNTLRCYLWLHSVASSPSYICTTPSCTNLPLHMLHRAGRLQWAWIWISVRDSLETFHKKKYCSSQHLNPCLELPPPPKRNIMRMKAQTHKFNYHIFFVFGGVYPVLLVVIPFCWYCHLPDGLYF